MSSFQSARTARPPAARSKRKPHRTRLWLRSLEERIAPANLIVTDPGDTVAAGQLRQILAIANSNGEDDTITFAPSITTINLAFGQMSINANQSLVIDGGGKVTINGATTRSATNRIFNVSASGSPTVTLQGLTLANCDVNGSGGAISVGFTQPTATLIVSNCTIHDCSAASGNGGAIAANFTQTTASLVLSNCTIRNNSASGGGGGIFFARGNLSVTDCKIDHNSPGQTSSSGTVNGAGGGVCLSGSITATFNRTTISNNTSPSNIGSGMFAENCRVDLTDSSIVSNSGGGCKFRICATTLTNCTVANNSVGSGYTSGGLYLDSGSTTLTNCTIVNNTAASGAGGMDAYGPLTIRNCTIVSNTCGLYQGGGGIYQGFGSGTISVNSSIITANISANSPDDLGFAGKYSGNNNFIGTGTVTGTNNLIGTGLDPLLFPLGDYGGPTQTMPPKYTSPVLDKGANPANLQFDQRGQPRVANGAADIGAVEGYAPLPFVIKSAAFYVAGTSKTTTSSLAVSVTYDSAIGIDLSTFDGSDISVTGPYPVGPITFDGYTTSGSKVTAKYLVSPPGGLWNQFNVGVWTVTVNGGEVSDIASPAKFAPGQTYGSLYNSTVGNYVVDSLADTVDGDYGPGQLTLREAVQLANIWTNSLDTISFSPTLFSSAQTITLGSELLITGGVVINGPGAGLLALSGNDSHRIIKTAYGPGSFNSITVSGLTFAHGRDVGDLTNRTGQGGAIYAGANLTLFGCILRNNSATSYGGAIYGLSTLINCAIINNTAGYGGGIYGSGTVSITNSTVSGNWANVSGGGFFLGNGLTAKNTTVTANLAQVSGGGIASTVTTSLNINLSSTIVAKNYNPNTPDFAFDAPFNISGDNNLIGVANAGNVTFTGTGNLTGTLTTWLDPMLEPLSNNGGPTPTHALKIGSPANDAGNNAANLANDQRGAGFPRTIGVKTDIGAYEFLPPAPTVTNVTFGDGTNQRSLVKQIVVTFSEAVNFMGSVASAFTLHRTGTGGVIGDVALTANPATGPASSVTITFSGSLTEFGSLVDGKYDFTIDAAQVSGVGGALDGNNDGTPGGSYFVNGTAANKFYRLFGDSNGDGVVGQTVDMLAFKNAFGFASPIFDFDNNGVVDQVADFLKFKNNFGMTP